MERVIVSDIRLREATPSDAAAIVDFNRRLAWETEQKTLDTETLSRGVARLLGEPAAGFYRIAESAGEVVGQLMVTFEWSDWRDGWFWWVQSVYVREDLRRSGVFRSLFEDVVRMAKECGDVVGVRLYVERDNLRAQQTYAALGMADPGYLVRELML